MTDPNHPGEQPPPHGQPPYGQPPAQPPQGQPPAYGQPAYGQPSPPYGQPPAAHPGYPPPGTTPQPGYGAPAQVPGLPPGVQIPSLGDRFLGRLIDSLVLIPVVLFLFIIGALTGSTVIMLFFLAVVFCAGFAYDTWMIADRGQTIGKKARGMRVVMLDTGLKPDQRAAAGRSAIYNFAWIACCIGATLVQLSPLFDEQRRQGWQDKVAKTIVIKG